MPCLVCALGLVVTAFTGGNTAVALSGMTLAAAGASTAQAALWSLPSAFLAGAAAAAGLALVNPTGNLGGFAGPCPVGFMTDLTHSTTSSLLPFAAFLVVGGLLILTIPARLVDR